MVFRTFHLEVLTSYFNTLGPPEMCIYTLLVISNRLRDKSQWRSTSGFRELKTQFDVLRANHSCDKITGPFSSGGEQNKSMAMTSELYYCCCCYPYISDKGP